MGVCVPAVVVAGSDNFGPPLPPPAAVVAVVAVAGVHKMAVRGEKVGRGP